MHLIQSCSGRKPRHSCDRSSTAQAKVLSVLNDMLVARYLAGTILSVHVPRAFRPSVTRPQRPPADTLLGNETTKVKRAPNSERRHCSPVLVVWLSRSLRSPAGLRAPQEGGRAGPGGTLGQQLRWTRQPPVPATVRHTSCMPGSGRLGGASQYHTPSGPTRQLVNGIWAALADVPALKIETLS